MEINLACSNLGPEMDFQTKLIVCIYKKMIVNHHQS